MAYHELHGQMAFIPVGEKAQPLQVAFGLPSISIISSGDNCAHTAHSSGDRNTKLNGAVIAVAKFQ